MFTRMAMMETFGTHEAQVEMVRKIDNGPRWSMVVRLGHLPQVGFIEYTNKENRSQWVRKDIVLITLCRIIKWKFDWCLTLQAFSAAETGDFEAALAMTPSSCLQERAVTWLMVESSCAKPIEMPNQNWKINKEWRKQNQKKAIYLHMFC